MWPSEKLEYAKSGLSLRSMKRIRYSKLWWNVQKWEEWRGKFKNKPAALQKTNEETVSQRWSLARRRWSLAGRLSPWPTGPGSTEPAAGAFVVATEACGRDPVVIWRGRCGGWWWRRPMDEDGPRGREDAAGGRNKGGPSVGVGELSMVMVADKLQI